MTSPSTGDRLSDKKAKQAELLEIIRQLIDGVDGYECEHGDLRYWKRAQIEQARRLIGAAEGVQ
jgi:hypothetical protein